MILENIESLINHIRELINIQEILKEIRETTSLNDKKAILSQYKEDKNLQQVIKYTYSPKINFGENVKENIINLEESNTFEYVYPLWYMLDKLANNNTNKLVQQEFKDYMAFFPDINDLITGIITKDLNLGLSIKSINKIMNNLDLIDENENSDNKVVNLCNYK
ncbi:MAG: hypothetical protein U0N84_07410 [Terrisporobacter sp.]|uniref:hypothetical protein n=1 Tax=Terrisporobacter sp. TaxID=1965305 RepID=UPI002F92A019